jgi:hypothetical protein
LEIPTKSVPLLPDRYNTMNVITYGLATTAADFEQGKALFGDLKAQSI